MVDTRDSPISFDVLPSAAGRAPLDAVVKKDLLVKTHNGSFRSVSERLVLPGGCSRFFPFKTDFGQVD